jgi:hypothetical protein
MVKEENGTKLSALVQSITSYAPQQTGVRSLVFQFCDKALDELKKAGIKTPFQRAALNALARKDAAIREALNKAKVHKNDQYNRISMYVGHWIVKQLKAGTLSIEKDETKKVWLTIK